MTRNSTICVSHEPCRSDKLLKESPYFKLLSFHHMVPDQVLVNKKNI